MKNSGQLYLKLLLLYIGSCLLIACSSQKDTAMSRGMQNLSARYNYIYNAKVILNNYEEALYQNYADNYNEILPVYTTPEKFDPSLINSANTNNKDLDAIITKSQAIISDKSFSNYIDDAYLLLGKAHYFKSDYFTAQEYFDYAVKTYPDNGQVVISGLNWKARSLMQTNNLTDAALVLDTVYTNLSLIKTNTAEPKATISQMFIYQDKIDEAIALLQQAIKESDLKRNRIRWTYILAQLYEKQKNYEQALYNYKKVQNSNAAFELYFNANLSTIKINGLLKGNKLSRSKQLLMLLKDDKNLEYTDQVYYQVAESYADDNNYTEAEKYYSRSIYSSTKNSYQKGLSYLKIADLNFKYLKDFLKAKLYYDSTINTLPKSYPGYRLIVKKTQNLAYLTKRYDLIAMQDTLQLLSTLSEEDRLAKIKKLIAPKVSPPVAIAQANTNPFPQVGNNGKPENASTFYFSNSTAVSRGYADFLIKWGNRKLEDNWRQSVKSSAQNTAESIAQSQETGVSDNISGDLQLTGDNEESISRYFKAIPVTSDMLTASNQKIIDAYVDIATFYQQELNDTQEAIRIYQLVLARYPENNRLASIYYSLYLGYKSSDPAQSNKYKDLILTKFASGVFAKTILDPSFSTKQSEIEADAMKKYNVVFDKYERKAFPEVINESSTIISQHPESGLNPQLGYLKAIAIGRTQPVDSLVIAFKNISNHYPDDKVIVPLVNDHLAYLAAHMEEFKKRKIALPDFDRNELRFFTPAPAPVQNVSNEPQITQEPLPATVVGTQSETVTLPKTNVNPGEIFSKSTSQTYYFVIDVEDATLTLSSSRFGIGQFNRGNYAESGLKHRLTEFDNDQLIYVGNFSSFAEAKSYADGLTPQLKQIMKVPAGIYTSFVISKENFEKLQSKDLVTKYLEFYKNNY